MSVAPIPSSFHGLHVLVVGLGKFGGGVETTRFLIGEGASVTVSDTATREDLEAAAVEVESLGGRVVFGPQTSSMLEGVDALVVSPAIPFGHELVLAGHKRGLPVTTEINIALRRCPAPVLGVTGTKGKSTTTHLLVHMLQEGGYRVHVGGNIGQPLVSRLNEIEPSDLVVLELSSFQLWWCHHIRQSPHVAVVTNLMSDHLDRHGTREHYIESKRSIVAYQRADDFAVLPTEDVGVRNAAWARAVSSRVVAYGEGGDVWLDDDDVLVAGDERLPLGSVSLRGAHNRRNIVAAAAAARTQPTVDLPAIVRGARRCRPLPHRLSPVATLDSVLYVDDSNATHPESTLAALAAYADRGIVLLVGGKDKGSDTSSLVEAARRTTRGVVGIGTTGPALIAAVGSGGPKTGVAQNMEEALRLAASFAQAGDVVLLSPGYSSLDQFASFVARGEAFQRALAGRQGAAETR